MSMGGNPARIDKLSPGTYTVCASPFPAEVGFDVEDYLVREGDNLPVFCKHAQVAHGDAAGQREGARGGRPGQRGRARLGGAV